MNKTQETQLFQILNSPETFRIETETPEYIRVHAGWMYDRDHLEMSFNKQKELIELFDAENILFDTFSESGCESCDWGSEYGFNITIIKKS